MAAASLPRTLSRRAKAATIARQVVAAYLRSEARVEQIEVLLHAARLHAEPDPIEEIAIAPDSVVSAKVIAIRMERFEARGALQLSVQEWQAETAEIATMVEEQLARRFRYWV